MFVFVNMTPYFTGHLICDSSSWLHSTNWLDPEESYHPTASGQADAYYPLSARPRSNQHQQTQALTRSGLGSCLRRPARRYLLTGKPRLTPPWLGSSQRDVTVLPRV